MAMAGIILSRRTNKGVKTKNIFLINRKIMKSHDKYLDYFLTHSGMCTLLKQTFTGSPHDVRH